MNSTCRSSQPLKSLRINSRGAKGFFATACGIMSVGAGEAHILNVCIRDEYRSRGFARKVLLYLLERARAAGMSEAFLEVRPSNVAAARLYHSLGFEQVGIRRGYYQAIGGREDAAVLRRLLTPDTK
jgi:ribosomal-protein-alanine N-acetyltransferase